jgi:hypothetical protein
VDYEVTNNNNGVLADGQFARTEFEALAISEAKFGVEWKKCCCAGVEFFVDGTVEGQYWHGAGNAISTTTDLGMLGVGVSAGFHR